MTKDGLYTKRDATLGGPGLDGYAYQADVYCVECSHDIIEGLDWPCDELTFQDSESVPQPIFFGESDIAQHCADCGEYLYGPQDENPAETDEPED